MFSDLIIFQRSLSHNAITENVNHKRFGTLSFQSFDDEVSDYSEDEEEKSNTSTTNDENNNGRTQSTKSEDLTLEFLCKKCNQRFNTKLRLRRHKDMHNGKTKYRIASSAIILF